MAWLWGKQTSEKKPHVWTAFLVFKIEWTRTKCSVQISLKLSISASLICALLSNIVLEEPIFRAFTCTESLWKYQKWHFPSQVSLNSKTGSYLSLFLCPKAFLFQFATSNVILWFSDSPHLGNHYRDRASYRYICWNWQEGRKARWANKCPPKLKPALCRTFTQEVYI